MRVVFSYSFCFSSSILFCFRSLCLRRMGDRNEISLAVFLDLGRFWLELKSQLVTVLSTYCALNGVLVVDSIVKEFISKANLIVGALITV